MTTEKINTQIQMQVQQNITGRKYKHTEEFCTRECCHYIQIRNRPQLSQPPSIQETVHNCLNHHLFNTNDDAKLHCNKTHEI